MMSLPSAICVSSNRDSTSRRRNARGASLFCSGRTLALPLADARLLADTRLLDGAAWNALSEAGREAAHGLYQAGHYALLAEDPDADCDDA